MPLTNSSGFFGIPAAEAAYEQIRVIFCDKNGKTGTNLLKSL